MQTAAAEGLEMDQVYRYERMVINVKRNTVELSGLPSPRQKEFLMADTRYVAYGGARGGGKSWALRRKCLLMAAEYPGLRILLLRRTLNELKENHVNQILAETGSFARYRAEERVLCFPNGSRLKLGYCDAESDVNQYQGQEYDVICIDEATQFTEFQFLCLCACLRGGNPKNPKRFYLSCNPGGVGHAWVKRLFIDRRYKKGESPEDYTFISARVFDNEFLMKNDPGYLSQLERLPEKMKRAWLYGEWDVFAGQFFSEFRREIHTTRPFSIPASWPRFFSCDYGLDMLAGLWIALSPEGTAYVYREIYESNLIASAAAQKILACEEAGEPIESRLAPPDLWGRAKDSGKNIIEIFGEHGLYFTKADNNRVQGWMALREWLKPFDNEGRVSARLKIFESCVNLIRTLPMLQYAKKTPNDAATEPHEPTHAPDALRYWAVSRPVSGESGAQDNGFPGQRASTGEILLRDW